MGDPVTMALVGAGIGGGTSLIKGKSLGKSLKNAAIGGTLGYGGGLDSVPWLPVFPSVGHDDSGLLFLVETQKSVIAVFE